MKNEIDLENFINHEVRLRMLESQFKIVLGKMNLAISLIVGAIIIPIALKFFNLV